jgi:hypothetical protein
MGLDITDNDVYNALVAFIKLVVPAGTPIARGQQNRVPMPTVPFVLLTTMGAPQRLSTNVNETTYGPWTADSTDVTADASITTDSYVMTASVAADYVYRVQADFYSPIAESWAVAAELLWRDNIGISAMPPGAKPLYTEDGPRQAPIITAENQWGARWTMTLVLDYRPTWTQQTEAATTVTVTPEPVGVFFPP